MRLSAAAAQIPHRVAGEPGDPEIAFVTHDSRRARPGALFAAFPGIRADGRAFLADAVERGAVAALGPAPPPESVSVPYLEVEEPRRAAGLVAAALAGRPGERLVMVGVTGTSGKTTTTILLDALLSARHEKRGLFGTLVYRAGGTAVEAARTTPEATELQPMLAELLASGGTAVAMECSSHALVLDRLAGTSFDVAVFLNLSRDHLDFHRDMEDYFAAKSLLFGMLKPRGRAVVNAADPYGRRVAEALGGRALSFALEGEADVTGRAEITGRGTRVTVGSPAGDFVVASPLLGRPNAENLLAAAAVGVALGFGQDEIARTLGTVSVVPGRLEPVPGAGEVTVLVDYAHKPGALEGVLKTARTLVAGSGRLLVVFGCGGDRDRGKRPEMGQIAATLADEVLLTSDNPRSEDPEAILSEIEAGVRLVGRTAWRNADRRAAIAEALGRARAGDVVVIAGKGHETYQETAGVKRPFDDRVVTREILEGVRR